MKVAYFIGSLNRGGTETLVLDEFRRKGVAPFDSILIYRNDGDLSDAYRETGVPMLRFKPQRFKLGYVLRLRKILKEQAVDILHTQTLLNSFLGLFCVVFLRTKLVASFHGLFTSFPGRFMTHLVMWFADASVFVSGHVRDWYVERTVFAPIKRCFIVYNGVDVSKFDRKYAIPDFLDSFDRESWNRSVKLAMIGNFVSGRSQLFICHCLKRLRDHGVDGFHFFFVGRRSENEPERYETCVDYCADHGLTDIVHFVGGRGDVPAILQYVDGFVYSSECDTFGIAVVEAMAAGVPVVVNDWGVMTEITGGGRFAVLYKTHDIEDCSNKMMDLILHNSNYKRKAQESAAILRERYSIENHIWNLYKVYSELF